MADIVGESIKQHKQEELAQKVIIDAKKAATKTLEFVEELERLNKPNKKSREAKKTLQKFINCHISNPAVYKRYQEVMILMEKFAQNAKHEG